MTSVISKKPAVAFRQEFDECALLHDPDTARVVALNPMGARIWQMLDGAPDAAGILAGIAAQVPGLPEDSGRDILDFLRHLIAVGMASSPDEAAP